MIKIFQVILFILMYSKVSAQTDNWTFVINDGKGTTQNYDVLQMLDYKDSLYATFGRTGPGAAEMYKSGSGDAGTWMKVLYDTITNTVKGIPSINKSDLDNGYLWIATGNPTQGTQVYRSVDGNNWVPISKKGFGDNTL